MRTDSIKVVHVGTRATIQLFQSARPIGYTEKGKQDAFKKRKCMPLKWLMVQPFFRKR